MYFSAYFAEKLTDVDEHVSKNYSRKQNWAEQRNNYFQQRRRALMFEILIWVKCVRRRSSKLSLKCSNQCCHSDRKSKQWDVQRLRETCSTERHIQSQGKPWASATATSRKNLDCCSMPSSQDAVRFILKDSLVDEACWKTWQSRSTTWERIHRSWQPLADSQCLKSCDETNGPIDMELWKMLEAEVHVFSDSVLCLEKSAMIAPEIKFTERWNEHLGYYKDAAKMVDGRTIFIPHISWCKGDREYAQNRWMDSNRLRRRLTTVNSRDQFSSICFHRNDERHSKFFTGTERR